MNVPQYIKEAMNNAQLNAIKQRNASQVVINWLNKNGIDVEQDKNMEELLADTLDYGNANIGELVNYIESNYPKRSDEE